MTTLLARAFSIRPGEGRLVALFFAFFAGIGMFYTVGATVGDTLFLAHLPKHRVPYLLPWVYFGIAVANVLATLTFDAVQAKVSRTASILGTQVVLAASVVLARRLVEGGAEAVYFGLAIWVEVCALLSITLFFSFAGDYFRPRDARRLYGFIAGGMALGTLMSGGAIHLLLPIFGTKNLLYWGAGLLLLNTTLAALIMRVGTPIPHHETTTEDSTDERVPLKVIFARPYVRLLAVIVPISIIVSVLVDYQMKWIASSMTEERLARFFGSFYGWVGVAQILFQFLVVPRLLQRLGIINCLMIMPLGLLLGSTLLGTGAVSALWGVSVLWLSAGVNFLRMTLSETLDLPSRELLLLPLPTRLRLRAQPLMGGAVAPGAQSLGGLLMLATLLLGLGVETLSLVAVVLTSILLALLIRLRPLYRATLAATLSEHQLDATDLEQALTSPNVEPLLEDQLRSSDPEVVLSTLSLLADRPLGPLTATLHELVESDTPEIAIAALQRIAREHDTASLDVVERAWKSPHASVRRAAVLALCEIASEDAVDRVAAFLSSDDGALRGSAIVGLSRHCGRRGRELARPNLLASVQHESAAERAEAARLLGQIRRPGYADLLTPLLEDEAPEVRLAAVEACAGLGDPALLSPLLSALREPELRGGAMRALGAMPEEAAYPLLDILDDEHAPTSDRCAMARVLGHIGGERAFRDLWDKTGDEHDLLLRIAATEALGFAAGHGVRLPLAGLEQRVETLCRRLRLLSRARTEVEPNSHARAVFADHGRMYVELLLALLALRFHRRTLDRIRHNYFDEPRDAATRALELFDELLPRRMAPTVVGAMQRWLEPGEGAAGLTPRTERALLSSEPWLRVATLYHRAGEAPEPPDATDLDEPDRRLYRLMDVVRFLKRVPLFHDLPAYMLVEQARIVKWEDHDQGTTLVREGEEGDALYIVREGRVRVVVQREVIAELGEEECIGELSLIDGEPRSATVETLTRVRLLRIDADRFEGLLAAQPAVARGLLRTLDRRIRWTQGDQQPASLPPPLTRRSQFTRAHRMGLQQLISTISFLRRVELFAELSNEAMANLAGIAEDVIVYEGDRLFEEGDVGESLYLVCDGEIAIEAAGREVARLGRNACLGEMALISGLPRSASAIATGEGRLLRLGSDDFANLLASEPEIGLSLLRTLAGRLRTVTQDKVRRSMRPPA